MKGYICLYRKMLDWEWMQEPLTAHLFTCMLLLANSEEGWRYMGMELKAGQFITSLDKLSKQCGLSIQQVRSRLANLQRSGEIALKSTNKYTTITICNYSSYQFESAASQQTNNKQITNKQQTNNTQIADSANSTCRTDGISVSDIEPFRVNAECEQQTNNKQTTNKQHAKKEEKANIQINKQTTRRNSSETSCDTSVYDNVDGEQNEEINMQVNNIQYSISNTIDIKKKNKEKKDGEYTVQELEQMFEDFRRAYKGTKRGFQPEFDNFKKKHQDWKAIVPLLMPALERMNAWREQQTAAGCFVPQYAMLQTWLNQGRWTTEYEITEPKPNDHGNEKHTQCWSDNRPDAQGSFNYDETF